MRSVHPSVSEFSRTAADMYDSPNTLLALSNRRAALSAVCRRKPSRSHKVQTIRRKLSLSASVINRRVAEKFATRKSSPGRTRTYDPAINSRLLYQLSYRRSLKRSAIVVRFRGVRKARFPLEIAVFPSPRLRLVRVLPRGALPSWRSLPFLGRCPRLR